MAGPELPLWSGHRSGGCMFSEVVEAGSLFTVAGSVPLSTL